MTIRILAVGLLVLLVPPAIMAQQDQFLWAAGSDRPLESDAPIAPEIGLVADPPLDLNQSSNPGHNRGWVSLTAGGGADVNGFSRGRGLGLIRSTLGITSRWVGLQTSLAYVHEGGFDFGDWSVEGVVHLRQFTGNTPRAVPYLFAGPGLFFGFGGGTAAKFNFGGGVNYFIGPRWGVRFEVRDSVVGDAPVHHLDFTGGVVFRF